MNCIHLFPVYPEIFLVFSYDKTSQHSKWMDNLNVDWSSGWILSCFFGCEGKLHKTKPWINQGVQRNAYCYSWHEANIRGLQVRNENKLIKVKSETSPLLRIHIHHQICNLGVIQNQYPPPNVESCSYSKSKYTTCQDLKQGPSACKLSVQTTTPPVLDTILIEQQAIILPR